MSSLRSCPSVLSHFLGIHEALSAFVPVDNFDRALDLPQICPVDLRTSAWRCPPRTSQCEGCCRNWEAVHRRSWV